MRGNGRLSPNLAAALGAIIAALIAVPITVVTGFIPAAHSTAQKLAWIAGLLALVIVLGVMAWRSAKLFRSKSDRCRGDSAGATRLREPRDGRPTGCRG